MKTEDEVTSLRATLRTLHEDESGATATEYIILLILIACVVISVVRLFGATLSAKFDSANDAVRREVSFS